MRLYATKTLMINERERNSFSFIRIVFEQTIKEDKRKRNEIVRLSF